MKYFIEIAWKAGNTSTVEITARSFKFWSEQSLSKRLTSMFALATISGGFLTFKATDTVYTKTYAEDCRTNNRDLEE